MIVTTRTAASPLTAPGEDRLVAVTAAWWSAAATDDSALCERNRLELLTELAGAYGKDAEAVYAVMLDSGESATYAAAHVVRCQQDDERGVASDLYGNATWNALVDSLRGSLPDPLDMSDAYAVANVLCEESQEAWDAYRRDGLVIDWNDYTRPLPDGVVSVLDARPVVVAL